MGICWPSLFNQNHNSGWFLLRGFVDLLRVCSLNIISRNHSNNFLLINKQKTAARLVSSRASLTSWAEGNSLALVGNPSSDGVMIKNTIWGRCFTTSTSLAPHIFLLGWLGQTDSDFIVRWVKTALREWPLVVAVISVDAYPFLAFPDLTCHLEGTGINVFWWHYATW